MAAIPPLPATLDTQKTAATNRPGTLPNATSTYRYGPPVVVMRLPAAAKHITMGANNAAPRTYASGAAGPSDRYRAPGSAKILPPMVMLTIAAASAQKPTARVSTDGLGDDSAGHRPERNGPRPAEQVRRPPFLYREQGLAQLRGDTINVLWHVFGALFIRKHGDRRNDCSCTAGKHLAALAGRNHMKQLTDQHGPLLDAIAAISCKCDQRVSRDTWQDGAIQLRSMELPAADGKQIHT